MNTVDFCFWLQGHFELNPNVPLSAAQTEVIKNHLSLVFVHEIDPMREAQTSTPASVLNAVHAGIIPGKTSNAIPDGWPPNDERMRC